jgi:predicted nucleic acid-binding protein
MPEVIFDNCVLSNFALSEAVHIIRKLYENTSFVTNFVVAENMKGIIKGYSELTKIREAIREGWLKEVTLEGQEEKKLFESLSVSLGLGEASSLAVAKTRGFIFACDDMVARREAQLLNIKLTGTLGILIKAVKRRLINQKEADRILARMIENGFYSPVRSLKEIL